MALLAVYEPPIGSEALSCESAMYWSQAEQLQTMPQQPLCPGVTCADKDVTPIDNAAAVAPAKDTQDKKCDGKGGCPCCHKEDKAKDA